MNGGLLTQDEVSQWNTDGYLHIPAALPRIEVEALRTDMVRVHEAFTDPAHPADWADVFDAGNERDLSIANAVARVPRIAALLDQPSVFARVLGLMGPYLQVLGSEMFFRYPHDQPLVDFHTDVGPALSTVVPGRAGSMDVQLKVQFFLTDLSRPDSGNLVIVPGSHRRIFPGKAGYDAVGGSVQILARPGDAVIFPLNLGHAVAPNRTDNLRLSIVLRYGQLFCRPVDYSTQPPHLLSELSERRKRLLGDLGARHRPGDIYGVIPDQLDIIYGREWSHTAQARAHRAATEAAQLAYETR